ncbi:MAG: plastocyanin/azurin family copper-binding protein [candidate division WOR-3 bacterium]|jgi:plastocyanin
MFFRGKLLLIILVFLLFSINSSYAVTHEISMIENVFVPETLSVVTGDTVVWVNNGIVAHTATSGTSCNPDGLWDSGLVSPGDSFSFAFDSAADYSYFCIPHCNLGMIGLIIVGESGIGMDENDSSAVFKFKKTTQNLFAEEIKMIYKIKTREYINISVYGIDGQLIKILLSGVQDNGVHSITWNGRNNDGSEVPDGIYFCVAKVKGKGYLNKIIKLR